jgi:hypothetical protein
MMWGRWCGLPAALLLGLLVASAAVAAPAGRLWHTGTMVMKREGTKLIRLEDGSTVLASSDREAVPWPDGRQYVTQDHRAGTANTALTVTETGSGRVLQQASVDGYLRSLLPSPASRHQVLGLWSRSTSDPQRHLVVYDLAAHRPVFATRRDEADHAIGWLADGRIARLKPNGELHAVTLGRSPTDTTETLLARLNLPTGHRPTQLLASPDGVQLLLQLAGGREANPEVDYWLLHLRSGAFERLTETRMAGNAQWSPDGAYIAFERDPGSLCGGSSCYGTCRLRMVPATARRVQALDAAGDARKVMATDSFGQQQQLGCGLTAWTR